MTETEPTPEGTREAIRKLIETASDKSADPLKRIAAANAILVGTGVSPLSAVLPGEVDSEGRNPFEARLAQARERFDRMMSHTDVPMNYFIEDIASAILRRIEGAAERHVVHSGHVNYVPWEPLSQELVAIRRELSNRRN